MIIGWLDFAKSLVATAPSMIFLNRLISLSILLENQLMSLDWISPTAWSTECQHAHIAKQISRLVPLSINAITVDQHGAQMVTAQGLKEKSNEVEVLMLYVSHAVSAQLTKLSELLFVCVWQYRNI